MDIWKYVKCEPYTKDKYITCNDADNDDNGNDYDVNDINISNTWAEA